MTQKIIIQNLQKFTSNQQLLKDPTWMPIFESDIKSVFPKYQTTKIQRTKIKLDRCRLMMDHIDDFLLLQRHKKQQQKVDSQQLMAQIQALSAAQQQKLQHNLSIQHLDIISKKQLSEKIAHDLTEYGEDLINNKPIKNIALDSFVKNNAKWSQFFIKHCSPQSADKLSNDHQKYILSQSIQPNRKYESLNDTLSAQVLLMKHKQSYIKQKLFQILGNEKKLNELDIPSYLRQDWEEALKKVNMSKQ